MRELLGQEGREAFRLAKSQLLEAAALLNSFESGVLAEALSGTLSNRSVAGFNHQAYALLGAGATRWGKVLRACDGRWAGVSRAVQCPAVPQGGRAACALGEDAAREGLQQSPNPAWPSPAAHRRTPHLNPRAPTLVCSCRKGLAKRVGQNLDLVEQTQAAVAVAVEQLEASGRLAALPALDDVGCCAISCMDYREALQVNGACN